VLSERPRDARCRVVAQDPTRADMKRKTKIVCTLGPASDSERAISALARAGMDVARINFSHGDPESVRRTLRAVRRVSKGLRFPLGVIGDLPGPKIRLGRVADGTRLRRGQRVVLTASDTLGDAKTLPLPYPGVVSSLRRGHDVFLDDGSICLQVVSRRGDEAVCKVVVGGPISSHKGVAVPDTKVSAKIPTKADLAWIKLAAEHRFDWIAASFVGGPKDIDRVRAAIGPGVSLPIIAKIEKRAALDSIDAIIQAADGIMVARGDLGVEIPIEQVPLAQKDIIARARSAQKPVITATQMLESMTDHRRPTRAEATDVANAVLDGTDAVMLSAETAIGSYPKEAVAMMAAIARTAETAPLYEGIRLDTRPRDPECGTTDAIAGATVEIAARVRAKAIVTFTASGHTAHAVSSLRPAVPIVAATMSESVQRALALSWGISAVLVRKARTTDEVLAWAGDAAETSGFAKTGDTIVITAGVPAGIKGMTNLIKVATV
jgi:pyruvate kinase